MISSFSNAAGTDVLAWLHIGDLHLMTPDARGRQDVDAITPAPSGWTLPQRAGDGSDRDRVGAWPEKGILDTQLGPNRNGRKW